MENYGARLHEIRDEILDPGAPVVELEFLVVQYLHHDGPATFCDFDVNGVGDPDQASEKFIAFPVPEHGHALTRENRAQFRRLHADPSCCNATYNLTGRWLARGVRNGGLRGGSRPRKGSEARYNPREGRARTAPRAEDDVRNVLMSGFAARLIAWQRRHGRHELPWQRTRDPYAIWISEIMLQQTQVATVIPYYRRFIARFPDIAALAAAPLDDVLRQWSGLGYYSRARNLHRAAELIVRDHQGRFPRDFDAVLALPGVGPSTAAAICAFAFGMRRAILDGNVKRVLARYFGIRGYPGDARVESALWRKAESLLPQRAIGAYTQALMDLGAGVCTRTRPRCAACPLMDACVARKRGLTERLPARRPAKRLPHRNTIMLVLQHAGEVLLERRPAAGVWGGLWCFPEAAPGESVGRLCRRRFGAAVQETQALPRVEHGFTHFRLTIEPRRLLVSRLLDHAAGPGHVWLPIDEAKAAAVPAPVKRILAGL